MKKLLYAVLAFAIVIFSSCSNENNTITDNTTDKTAAKFTSVINNNDGTKVNGAAWSPNDSIAIFMKTAGADFSMSSIAPQTKPFRYVTNGDGIFAPASAEETFYLPKEKNVDFIAYYPADIEFFNYYGKNEHMLMIFSSKMDFMISTNATNVSNSTPNVNLHFKRKMSKLVFNIIPGTGLTKADLENLDMSLWYIYLTSAYSLKTNEYIDKGDKMNDTGCHVTMAKDGLSGECIIIPQTITEDKYYDSRAHFFVGKTTPEGGFTSLDWTWIIPKGLNFEEGKQYTFNITLNRNPRSLSVNSQISDWVTEDPINVVVN